MPPAAPARGIWSWSGLRAGSGRWRTLRGERASRAQALCTWPKSLDRVSSCLPALIVTGCADVRGPAARCCLWRPTRSDAGARPTCAGIEPESHVTIGARAASRLELCSHSAEELGRDRKLLAVCESRLRRGRELGRVSRLTGTGPDPPVRRPARTNR